MASARFLRPLARSLQQRQPLLAQSTVRSSPAARPAAAASISTKRIVAPFTPSVNPQIQQLGQIRKEGRQQSAQQGQEKGFDASVSSLYRVLVLNRSLLRTKADWRILGRSEGCYATTRSLLLHERGHDRLHLPADTHLPHVEIRPAKDGTRTGCETLHQQAIGESLSATGKRTNGCLISLLCIYQNRVSISELKGSFFTNPLLFNVLG